MNWPLPQVHRAPRRLHRHADACLALLITVIACVVHWQLASLYDSGRTVAVQVRSATPEHRINAHCIAYAGGVATYGLDVLSEWKYATRLGRNSHTIIVTGCSNGGTPCPIREVVIPVSSWVSYWGPYRAIQVGRSIHGTTL